MENKRSERQGEINYNYYGNKMTIIEYKSARSVLVQFENGYTTLVNYKEFQKGCVKSPYDKSIHAVGYIGEGNYPVCINGKATYVNQIWRGMLERCYSKICHEKHPTYKDCTVAPEWHNFQNYAAWFDNNYYEIANEKVCLDKDILLKGNKIYSPDTCVFAPATINGLFTKTNARRGNCPIGVFYHERLNKYEAHCNNGNRNLVYLGLHETSEEAFISYKHFKENYIKEVANLYKNKIPQKLYNALYNYKVEISD